MPSSQVHSAVDTPTENHPPGSLFMVVVPFGAGKSTLVNALLTQNSSVHLSVSATTHRPCPGKQHGHEYNFMTVEEFKACRDHGEFLEWAEVYGSYHVTSRVWIEEQIRAGTDVLLKIDWRGVQQVHQRFSNAVEISILPPSLPTLKERLKKCGQDRPNVIVRRLLAASSEMVHASEADYVIISEVLNTALAELRTVMQATHLRFDAQKARRGELSVELGIH